MLRISVLLEIAFWKSQCRVPKHSDGGRKMSRMTLDMTENLSNRESKQQEEKLKQMWHSPFMVCKFWTSLI